MNGGHGAVVAGIHGLQHIHGFAAPHLSNYYAVRTHTESGFYKVSDGYFGIALHICIFCLETYKVFYALYLKLRIIFNGYDPFTFGNPVRKNI